MHLLGICGIRLSCFNEKPTNKNAPVAVQVILLSAHRVSDFVCVCFFSFCFSRLLFCALLNLVKYNWRSVALVLAALVVFAVVIWVSEK